jgi:hypothetical protein
MPTLKEKKDEQKKTSHPKGFGQGRGMDRPAAEPKFQETTEQGHCV